MDVQEDDDILQVDSIEDEDFIPLSPIVEMDENSDVGLQSEDFVEFKGDRSKRSSMVDTKLILETTVENFEDRPSQPETPPEILRVRLNSLQNDYEELREFTDLERQLYHADCVPREEVKSLEEELALLKEKVQYLMQENSEYQKKLEVKEDEQKNLKSEITIVKECQNESMILIRDMIKKLRTSIKDDSTVPEEIQPSNHHSFLETCGDDFMGYVQGELFNCLRDFDNLLETSSKEKEEMQDKVEHLQLKVNELNIMVEEKNREISVCQQSLISAKTDTLIIQEKCSKIGQELTEISVALSVSENRYLEAEEARDNINSLLCKFKNEKDNTQEKIVSVICTLENFIESLCNDSVTQKGFISHAEVVALGEILKNNYDLCGVLTTLAFLNKIFLSLLNEVNVKDAESYELKLTIDQLKNHLMKYEEDVKKQQIELGNLSQEVNEHIPCRLLEFENCLYCKDSEILRLQDELKSTDAKLFELQNKLSQSSIREDQLQDLLSQTSVDKKNLENEIFKLRNSLTIDDLQNDIALAVKSLEDILDSWDEKSNLGDLVNAVQNEATFHNLTNLLMNVVTHTIFNAAALKCKTKLLIHDEETNRLCSEFENMKNGIDRLKDENKNIRLEVNELNLVVRQGISCRVENLELFLQKGSVFERTDCNCKRVKSDIEQCDQEEDLTYLKTTNGKRQKQINNLNKCVKPDNGLESITYILNELENLIDSWDCTKKSHVSEFTHSLYEKSLECFDRYDNSKIENNLFKIKNKLEAKLMEIFEMKNQLPRMVNTLHNPDDGDQKQNQDLNKCTLENLQWTNDVPKIKGRSNNYKEKTEYVSEKEITTIKKLMCMEITSLDESENEETLMYEPVENIFSKLMQVIILKEQEMTMSLEKQQKEKVYNLKQTIEKLNNKLKSQESWTNSLESENDKINNDIAILKSVNNSLELKLKSLSNDMNIKDLEIDNLKEKVFGLMKENDSLISELETSKNLSNNYRHSNSCLKIDIEKLKEVNNSCELKLKSFSDDINNKNLEIDNMKGKVVELLKENDSLISELETSKNLNNNYRHSVSCLEIDIEKLKEEIIHKSNLIVRLESTLISDLHRSENLDIKLNISSSNSLNFNGKGDFFTDGFNQTLGHKFPIVVNEGSLMAHNPCNIACLDMNEDENEQIPVFETGFFEMLRKEIAFVNDMLHEDSGNISLSERFASCHENLTILKEVIQNIGSKILKLEMSHLEKLKSIQTALEYKTKELCDFKLSISNLCQDLVSKSDQMRNAGLIDEKFPQNSISTVKKEVDKIKTEFVCFSSKLGDFEESAKMGQNIVQNLKKNVETILNENINMAKLIQNLNKLIGNQEENSDEQKKRADSSTKENIALKEQILCLDNEIRNLKLELSQSKREVVTLKQSAETLQNVCYGITEELRFFGYHCELMLSYIQSLEFKLNFTAQQKELLEKDNTLLKGQLTSQYLEMNRFFKQIVLKSPFTINTQSQAVDVISHVFSEFKSLKENENKYINENKLKQEKILQLKKELSSLAKQNSSLKFELTNCEDSIRNLRSELRNTRLKCQRKESISFDLAEAKQKRIDSACQTEATCCSKLQRQLTEQKEEIIKMAARLTQCQEQVQSSLTSNPYNKQVAHPETSSSYKQVAYLEGALAQAKEKIGRLHFTLKQQESFNQELVEALRRQESAD